ncbi:PRC-barrel domain-containing protein [Pedobacter chinensis]|nr:PRC-barrel domain-containing protein [Pedobacter chinensis]
MSQEDNNYNKLEELSGSDYQIVGDEPNIIGWTVKNENDTSIGKVKELLFDPGSRAVRYLIITLDESILTEEEKEVAVPIGIAHLHTSDDEVVLPNIHPDQLISLPRYERDTFGHDTEVYIREVIGSPAALRIEESIVDYDRERFYEHHHFDRANFYRRGGLANGPFDTSSQESTTNPPGQTGDDDIENSSRL